MRWYANLSMRTKLMTAFMSMIVLMALVGAVGIKGMSDSNRALDSLSENELAAVATSSDLRGLVLDTGRLYRQIILDAGAGASRDNVEKINANLAGIANDLDALAKLEVRPSERALLADLQATLPDWKERLSNTVQLALAGDVTGARAAAAANGANAGKLVTTLAALTKGLTEGAESDLKATDAADARNRTIMLIVIALGIAAGIGMGLTIANVVATPLQRAVRVLGAVAEGDFTQHLDVDTRDEVGQMATALNRAVDGMRTSLSEVRHSAAAVSSASRELSASSSNISAGAQEQASSLEETAAALEEITSTVQQNADNSQQASQIAKAARGTAEKGGAIVSEAVTAMKAINASSKQIGEIITTIDEIAFQTNLLALNAAVEAARAGEQGRGFAVVAGEVRNLAQRSASAAKEIKGLIQDSVDKVESGTDLVNRSGEVLEEIVAGVGRVTDIVAEIAAASREQSTGIGEVGTAVTQMDQVTQANAAQTEELAGTAESLSAQAEQLQAMVARYRLGDDAGTIARANVVAPPAPGASTRDARGAKPRLAVVKRRIAATPAAPVAAATGTDGGFEEF